MITHKELIQMAEKWLNRRCGVVLTEYKSYSDEIPDAIGFRSDHSILIECKTTLADYKADGRKPHRHNGRSLGTLKYYLVPDKLITTKDLPIGWGLLYALASGRIRTVKKGDWNNDSGVKKQEYLVLYSIARRIAIRGLLPKIYEDLPSLGFNVKE